MPAWLRSLRRQAEEIWEVPRDLLRRRYPPFVTGGELPRGHVPVFVFHSVEPESFGRKLDHLAENGYLTLGTEEYLAVLRGEREPPERAVVLTFDDGRGSLWTVGAPLLRRRGMKGIVFLVPGRMASRAGPPLPTLDDVGEGRAPETVFRERERGEGAFLSWEEVEALARSGVFEFESHTLRHARVHVAPRVVGFLTPEMRTGYAALDVPLLAETSAGADVPRDLLAGEAPLGTPLLESAPRTAEVLRFYEDPEVRQACIQAVAERGGEDFFAEKGWARELRARLRGLERRVPGRLETPEERERALRVELQDARSSIEEHTGRPVRLLCYPWHAWGPTSRRLARECGHEAAFCGKVAGAPMTLPGGDLLAVARVGEDYVELLPGHGRGRLSSVLTRKWRRRLGTSSRAT